MNYDEIKKLMDDMGKSKIDSLEIEFPDGIKISMQKNTNRGGGNKTENVVLTSNVSNDNVTTIAPVVEEVKEDYFLIKSPMVGTFYSRSAPDKEAFVKVGDVIKKGDPLCIIEAMKLMNEIESECDGTVIEICMKDEQMVEYGQVIFKIKEN